VLWDADGPNGSSAPRAACASELDATQRCATMKSVAIHIVPIHIVAMAAALLARTGHFVAEIQGGE
jgi:hypothetical protein